MKPHVELRNFSISDVDLLVKYMNNTEVTQYITDAIPKPYSSNDAVWWVNHTEKSNLIQAIDVDGMFVGCISATRGNFEYSRGAELGYWVGRDFWNRGIATEAVSQFTASLFANTDIVRLFVQVVSTNVASMTVLKKNGYMCDGLLKNASYKNGQFYDEYLMSKIKL